MKKPKPKLKYDNKLGLWTYGMHNIYAAKTKEEAYDLYMQEEYRTAFGMTSTVRLVLVKN